MFLVNVDFFNIEGNCQWITTTSCGIISCACLNLPLDIHYKPENMYLAGIKPSPHKPSGDEVNFFLNLLINDMVDSWVKGIQFTHMSSGLHHVTCSAIEYVVCDLPAAWKALQLASVTSHVYCSTCHCHHISALGKSDIDSPDWNFCNKSILHHHAKAYKNAISSAEHHKLFV